MLNTNFNQKYLRYRIIFYWQQVKELLYKYRLFAIFIILITSSSLNHVKYIGYPIAALIVNSANINFKVMSLVFIIFTIFIIGKSQSAAINGGAFRYYIDCLYPENNFNKIIDIFINIIAMNMVLVLFSLAYVYCDQWFAIDKNEILRTKFVSALLLLIALQMNIVCNNKLKIAFSVALLSFFTFIAKYNFNEFYLVVATIIGSLCLLSSAELNIKVAKTKSAYKLIKMLTSPVVKTLPFFTPQMSWVRANPTTFLFSCLIAFLISLLIYKLKALDAYKSTIVALFILQNFILSMQFIMLAKNEKNYKILYSAFSYRLRDFRLGDLSFISFCYFLIYTPLYFTTNINAAHFIIGLLTFIISRYYLCYYRNAFAFILLVSIFLNLLVVNL